MFASSGANCLLSWVSSFNPFIFVNSSRVSSFSYVIHFLFLEIKSFELMGLPRFRCVLDSFAMTFSNCPSGTSICVGAFTGGTCDFVTFLISVKSSGNWFASPCKWTILWTFNSHCLVQGSRWDKEGTYHVMSRHSLTCLPLMAGKHFHQNDNLQSGQQNVTCDWFKIMDNGGRIKTNIYTKSTLRS